MDWWKRYRRARILRQSFSADWPNWIAASLTHFRHWDAETQAKVLQDVRVFVAEKSWEGCEGLVVEDAMKVTVAAQAAMMLIGTSDYVFDGIQSILLYPHAFRRSTEHPSFQGQEIRSGEAWHRGPIVLSWADVRNRPPGRNVVIHELAHHLDGIDGEIGGVPVLSHASAQARWQSVSLAAFTQLTHDLEARRPTFLDHYAATNRAEFFAVACEAFFEQGQLFLHWNPDLYTCLMELFHVEPATWTAFP